MAAVLCNGINQCCQGLCRILSIPCQACRGCCAALNDACNGCCKATGKACRMIFCQSPFTPYILTTLALQVPPVVWGVMTLVSYAGSTACGDFLNLWMYVVALMAALHIVGAFYIALRMAAQTNPNINDNNDSRSGGPANERTNINHNNNNNNNGGRGQQQQQQQQQDEGKYLWDHVQDFFSNLGSSNNDQTRSRQQQQQQQHQNAPPPSTGRDQGGSNTWSRLKHLMCYDVGVAFYMLVFVAWMVWLPVGISTLVSVDDEDKDADEDCRQVANFARNSIVCGFVYGVVVALSFCCSLIFLRL